LSVIHRSVPNLSEDSSSPCVSADGESGDAEMSNSNLVVSVLKTPTKEKTDNSSATGETKTVRRIYLQREKVIREHAIWRSHRFWEDALQQGVLAQVFRYLYFHFLF
jgi:hypothetical protein